MLCTGRVALGTVARQLLGRFRLIEPQRKLRVKFSVRAGHYIVSLAALVVGISACSKMTARVTGIVELDGQPVKCNESMRGTVVFRPVSGGPTSTGLIDESGRYVISTGAKGALIPGDYMVAISITEIIPQTGDMPAPSGRSVVPALYSNPIKSGFVVTVRSGDNTIDLAMRSDAGPTTFATEAGESDESAAPEGVDEGPSDRREEDPLDGASARDASTDTVDADKPSEP